MSHHPEWLGRDLVAGALPWEQGLPSSLAAFLNRFTLRDSRWIGLYHEAEHAATLLLRWDTSQDATREPLPGAETAEWLLLAIRFDALERVEVKLRDDRIADAVSGATNRAADLHRTHLEDRRGGGVTLLHAPGTRLLCLTEARAPLSLPVPAETL
jgi:hypothetical protein